MDGETVMSQAALDTTFKIESAGDWGVLRPIGELDAYWAHELRDLMVEVAELHGNRVIVDLAGVGFVDSTAIGVLTGGWKRARNAGGEVRLAGANSFVRRVLDITGLGRVFDSFPSVEEAATAP